MDFFYDESGQVYAVKHSGFMYYYIRNGQGDIIGLVSGNANVVVEYTYDAWGKLVSITGNLAGTLGLANPFRYRGYYYDNETGLYYLNIMWLDNLSELLDNEGLKAKLPSEILEILQKHYHNNAWWYEEKT